MDHRRYCISPDLTVKDAIGVINKNDPQIVFITEGRELLASLTDGDVRRFLLKGGKLTDPAIGAGNRESLYAADRGRAALLYDQRDYVAIPIVVPEKGLIDIYIGEEAVLKERVWLDIPVVINAGGKGSRLEPYTKILPKPLIPIGEIPVIGHIMQRFLGYGCGEFSVIVNYKKEIMKA